MARGSDRGGPKILCGRNVTAPPELQKCHYVQPGTECTYKLVRGVRYGMYVQPGAGQATRASPRQATRASSIAPFTLNDVELEQYQGLRFF